MYIILFVCMYGEGTNSIFLSYSYDNNNCYSVMLHAFETQQMNLNRFIVSAESSIEIASISKADNL